jgi:RHS repeat-associated protein
MLRATIMSSSIAKPNQKQSDSDRAKGHDSTDDVAANVAIIWMFARSHLFALAHVSRRNLRGRWLSLYREAVGRASLMPRVARQRSPWGDAYIRLDLTAAAGTATLGYDSASRLYQTAGAATTRFLYDGQEAIAEYNSSNVLQRRYVFGPGTDEPIVWYEGSGTSDRRWLIANEQGSIIAVTDSSGAALNINSYDEYGQPASTNAGRFQFTGQMWLPEANLYNFKARDYSASLGRFMQTDPILQYGGLNIYAYVANDPINWLDSSGLDRICYERVAGREDPPGVYNFGNTWTCEDPFDLVHRPAPDSGHNSGEGGDPRGGVGDAEAARELAQQQYCQDTAADLQNMIATKASLDAQIMMITGSAAIGGGINRLGRAGINADTAYNNRRVQNAFDWILDAGASAARGVGTFFGTIYVGLIWGQAYSEFQDASNSLGNDIRDLEINRARAGC